MDCCHSSTANVHEDDIQLSFLDSQESASSTDGTEVLNTDYANVSPLFRNIEQGNWERVLMFLQTGKWTDSMLWSSAGHMNSAGPELQVKTWVTAYDRRSRPQWSQLPIHAAVSNLAPFIVIQKLIDMYPRGIHCTDSAGMLPIHLAFDVGAADNVTALLLERFPASVNVKTPGGQYPYECFQHATNQTRGKVLHIVSEQVLARSRKEMQEELRDFCYEASRSLGMKWEDLSHKEMSQFILELLQDRKHLAELKARGAGGGDASIEAANGASERDTEGRKQRKNNSSSNVEVMKGNAASTKNKNNDDANNGKSPAPSMTKTTITKAEPTQQQTRPKESPSKRRGQNVDEQKSKSKMASKPPSSGRRGRFRDAVAPIKPTSSKYSMYSL